eukprot:gene7470-8259_t
MEITSQTIEALNLKLNNVTSYLLKVSPEDRSDDDFQFLHWGTDSGDHREHVLRVSQALLLALRRLEEEDLTIYSLLGLPQTIEEVYERVIDRHPPFTINQSNLDYRLLHFLVTELQGSILLKRKERKSQSSQPSPPPPPPPSEAVVIQSEYQDNGSLPYHLLDLSTFLHINQPSSSSSSTMKMTVVEELDLVYKKVEGLLEENVFSLQQTTSSRRLLDALPSPTIDQQNLVKLLSEKFYGDFALRRQMILERLDVTLQTFLGGEEAIEGGGGGEKGSALQAAIDRYRDHLKVEPSCRYGLEEALVAPVSLLEEVSAGVSRRVSTSSHLVKKAVLGAVPDRGGRVNDIRVSSLKPMAMKGGRGDGRGGGYGRHGGRGGGRGGGGGRGKSSRSEKDSNDQEKDQGKGQGNGRVVEVVPADSSTGTQSSDGGKGSGRDKPPHFKRRRH